MDFAQRFDILNGRRVSYDSITTAYPFHKNRVCFRCGWLFQGENWWFRRLFRFLDRISWPWWRIVLALWLNQTISKTFRRWLGGCPFPFYCWVRFRWWRAVFHWILARFIFMSHAEHSIPFASRFLRSKFLSFSGFAHFSAEALPFQA